MIESERLRIDKVSLADFDRFCEINTDPRTNVFNPHGPMDRTIAQEVFTKMLDHWMEHGFGVWKIARVEDPKHAIGFGGLTNRLYGTEVKLNLGFRFSVEVWGKGYATEFGKMAIAYGFDALKRKEVYGLVRPDNLASIAVLKKCGMRRFSSLDDVPGEAESIVFRLQNPDV